MNLPERGDLWGGLAATLVALPAAIGFGVTVFSAIGPGFAAYGALAGIVGTVVIGIVASLLGGTPRLISAPCAPAAALLSAFALDMARRGDEPAVIVLLLVGIGILAGVVQIGLGLVGIGNLIRYIPYPVVSGYLTGVGLIIVGSQVPKLLGVTGGPDGWQALLAPALWDWRACAVGLATVALVLASPRWPLRLPGTIIGITGGVVLYFLIALGQPDLLRMPGNDLLNAAVRVRLLERLSVDLSTKNLLDQRSLYPMNSNASDATLADGTPAVEGRTYWVAVKWRF